MWLPEFETMGRPSATRPAIVATIVLVSALLVVSPAGAVDERVDPASGEAAMERQSSNATLSLAVAERSSDRITVRLSTDATDVAGYGANVTFDPAALAVESVSGVDMSDPIVNRNNEAGWVFLTQSRARGVDQPTLAEITFSVRQPGETQLSFVDGASTVNNGQVPPEQIPVDPVGTTVSAGGAGDGADGGGSVGDGTDGGAGSTGDGSTGARIDEDAHFAVIPVLILVPTLIAICALFVASSLRRRF
ncbi:cohesin domain-containing protein [Halovivax limisalsi]|uniref:cohesin domain-containing protein n=1 Tax=Halovivax limisalsi TaxID=1453760 RepID=UPI001FFC5356|nr:cohesin domain-containing protein [Halovivax limisalsi]